MFRLAILSASLQIKETRMSQRHAPKIAKNEEISWKVNEKYSLLGHAGITDHLLSNKHEFYFRALIQKFYLEHSINMMHIFNKLYLPTVCMEGLVYFLKPAVRATADYFLY